MTDTPRIGLPLIAAAQAQKHVTHNEALVVLDALLHLAVLGRGLDAPPAAPPEGGRWIVGAAPTGAWAGRAGQVAIRLDGGWTFRAPRDGWLAYALDEGELVVWTAADGWRPARPARLQGVERLGIGTAADDQNPFAAKLNKALWTALRRGEGGDGSLRYTLDKEASGDVLSLLLQSGFSGRAEIGLVGDDDLAVKVSGDGATWREAIRVARATGVPALPRAPKFLAAVSASQAVPAGAWTRVAFDAAVHDDQEVFSAPAKAFVAPAAGIYRLEAAVTFRAAGTPPTAMQLALHVNGAGREATQRGEAAPGGLASGVSGVATGALLRLSAGDAVDVRVLYTGAAGAIFHERCQFGGHLVP